jgi:hypothetical protein
MARAVVSWGATRTGMGAAGALVAPAGFSAMRSRKA